MSDELAEDFEKRLKTLDIIIKLGFALLAGAFGLGVWVATLEWRQGVLMQDVDSHDKTLSEFNMWRAETNGSRFTSQDYVKASANLQEALINHDKRLTRTEDTMLRLEKAMDRIELKLGTKQ